MLIFRWIPCDSGVESAFSQVQFLLAQPLSGISRSHGGGGGRIYRRILLFRRRQSKSANLHTRTYRCNFGWRDPQGVNGVVRHGIHPPDHLRTQQRTQTCQDRALRILPSPLVFWLGTLVHFNARFGSIYCASFKTEVLIFKRNLQIIF